MANYAYATGLGSTVSSDRDFLLSLTGFTDKLRLTLDVWIDKRARTPAGRQAIALIAEYMGKSKNTESLPLSKITDVRATYLDFLNHCYLEDYQNTAVIIDDFFGNVLGMTVPKEPEAEPPLPKSKISPEKANIRSRQPSGMALSKRRKELIRNSGTSFQARWDKWEGVCPPLRISTGNMITHFFMEKAVELKLTKAKITDLNQVSAEQAIVLREALLKHLRDSPLSPKSKTPHILGIQEFFRINFGLPYGPARPSMKVQTPPNELRP